MESPENRLVEVSMPGELGHNMVYQPLAGNLQTSIRTTNEQLTYICTSTKDFISQTNHRILNHS